MMDSCFNSACKNPLDYSPRRSKEGGEDLQSSRREYSLQYQKELQTANAMLNLVYGI